MLARRRSSLALEAFIERALVCLPFRVMAMDNAKVKRIFKSK